MDPSQLTASGVTVDGLVLGLFMLALGAIGALSMVLYNNVIKAIKASHDSLREALDTHIADDKVVEGRVNTHGERIASLEAQRQKP